MNDPTAPVRSIQSYDRDVFEGSRDLVNIFHGIADYLSLWCVLYGLRRDDIAFGRPYWATPRIMGFRITRGDGSPISPYRWSVLLPDVPRVFEARHWRIKRFVAMTPAFRRSMYACDHWFRDRASFEGWKAADTEVVSRWTVSGRVLLKVILKSDPVNPRNYLTHLRTEIG